MVEESSEGVIRSAPHHTDDLKTEAFLNLVQDFLAARARRCEPPAHVRDAWCRFFSSFDPLVRRVAERYHGNRSDTDDRVQEIWLAILTRFPRICDRSRNDTLRGLLTVIARHAISDYDRSPSHRPLASLTSDAQRELPGRESSLMARAELEEACREVRSRLEEFRRQSSEASFLLIYLHWIEEKSFEEIAAALGCTTKQVRDRHRRILLKLRSILRDPIDEDRV